jgi:hypothetical protein
MPLKSFAFSPLITKPPGKAYVVFGKKDNTAINLSAIASGTGGFVINGENESDESGRSVSTAGDVNGGIGVGFTEDDIGFACIYFTVPLMPATSLH